jgi:surface protein
MFSGAVNFNQDISAWNVSSVTNMSGMFSNAKSFNQDIGTWQVSNVKEFMFTFGYATSFNQNIAGWNVLPDSNTKGMFVGASMILPKLKTMDVASFFSGLFETMPPSERKKVFDHLFHWERRKCFVLFLEGCGYLHGSVDVKCDHISEDETKGNTDKVTHSSAPCDVIFDIEDIAKYICSFL